MSDIIDRVLSVGFTNGRTDPDVYEAVREIKRLRAALQYARNLIGPDEIIDAELAKN